MIFNAMPPSRLIKAVIRLYTTHIAAQCSALGLVDDDGHVFANELSLVAFYNDHFSGGVPLA